MNKVMIRLFQIPTQPQLAYYTFWVVTGTNKYKIMAASRVHGTIGNALDLAFMH